MQKWGTAHGRVLGFACRQGIRIKPVMTEHPTPTRKPETRRVLVERSGRWSSNMKLGGGRWMLHHFGTSLQPEYSSIYCSPTYSPSRKQRVHAETWIFRAALLVMAPNCRVTRCSSTRWWVNTLGCAHQENSAAVKVHCWYLQRPCCLSGHRLNESWTTRKHKNAVWSHLHKVLETHITQSDGKGLIGYPGAGGHLGARAADSQNVHVNNPWCPAFSQIGLYRETLTQAQGDVANVPHSWMEIKVGRKPLSTKS